MRCGRAGSPTLRRLPPLTVSTLLLAQTAGISTLLILRCTRLTLLLFTAGCSLRRILCRTALCCTILALVTGVSTLLPLSISIGALLPTLTVSTLLLTLGCTILVLTTGVSTLLLILGCTLGLLTLILTVLCCRIWLALCGSRTCLILRACRRCICLRERKNRHTRKGENSSSGHSRTRIAKSHHKLHSSVT